MFEHRKDMFAELYTVCANEQKSSCFNFKLVFKSFRVDLTPTSKSLIVNVPTIPRGNNNF